MEVRPADAANRDLFVSYAPDDQPWVDGYLIDALKSAGVRYHSQAAFTLGAPRITEFERAVRDSRYTLLVLSPAYLAGNESGFVDVLAQAYGEQTATWRVIPLLLGDVELPPRLAMLECLDARNPERWQAAADRLCEQLGSSLPSSEPAPPCPYPGMVPFSEADSERFYGRDNEVAEALQQLRLHPFLAMIGPSGSGKSSLVFAGLVPALRQSRLFGTGGWLVRAIRPGEIPLETLAGAIGGDANSPHRAVQRLLASEPATRRLLLVVDQFEEVFTRRPEDGTAFQQALLRLAGASDCYVVVTARADFYSDLMASPLWPHIQAHRFEVLPLSADGMRQAIRGPAASADGGVFVDPALVERLVTDVAGEPGSLPMVQETLVLIWDRLKRRYLSLRAYESLGEPGRTGLQVAMARRADAVLAALTEEQKAIARRIFLRLVQFGEGRADTRRQQPEASLMTTDDDPGEFTRTLDHLADNRLLTATGESAGRGGGWTSLTRR